MYKYIKNTQKVILASLLSFLILVTGCNKGYPEAKKIAYETAEITDTKEHLLDTLKAKPNEIQTEDTLESYIYKECTYLNHTGVMTYYMVDDKVLYSRWETTLNDTEKASQFYTDICTELETTYQKSSETEENLSKVSVWSSDKETKTITYLERDNDVMVSVMSQLSQ